MANIDHLRMIEKGFKYWNDWRSWNHDVTPDFVSASLSVMNLAGVNLSGANLSGANLVGTDLSAANLSNTNLVGVNLRKTKLVDCELSGANFSKVECGSTMFCNVNLSEVVGLETIHHFGPSYIDVHSIYLSKGKIPEIFLRGCGLPELFLMYLPSLLEQAIQFYSCFISYSHANKDFAQRLHDRLQREGIRCWLDEHQLNPGDPLHPTIYEAIRVYDKVLLCCSETSLNSWWVDKEFSRAIRKEEDYGDHVLVPLNLDGYLFNADCRGWIADEIKQRLVANLVDWKDHDKFEEGMKVVIKALRTDGGRLPPPEPKLKPKRQ